MKGPIQSVEVTYLVHATEDQTKVEEAVRRTLGIEVQPVVERLEGHFGNEILSVRYHLTGKEATRTFQSLAARLTKGLRAGLLADIGALVDEHSVLFLRFDKQRLVSGTLALGSRDSVRLKVKPRLFLLKGGAAEFYAGLIGGS